MPPRCLPWRRRRRRCQPLCATPRRRHPGPRRWPWPRHRRHRPGQSGRPPRRGPPGWAGRQHRAQPSRRSAPLQRDQRHPGPRGGFGVIISAAAGPADAVVRVIPVRGGGLGVIVGTGPIARTRGRLVPARVGRWVVPAGTAGQGALFIVRAGGRGVARGPGRASLPWCPGPGRVRPGTPASIGPISLIRFLRAAAVSLRWPARLSSTPAREGRVQTFEAVRSGAGSCPVAGDSLVS